MIRKKDTPAAGMLVALLATSADVVPCCLALSLLPEARTTAATTASEAVGTSTRRKALGWVATTAGISAAAVVAAVPVWGLVPDPAVAAGVNDDDDDYEEGGIPRTLDIDDYLRKGGVAQPMGVSGQAGKSRPETGVVLRDGSEISRNARTGDVLAEILLQSGSSSDDKMVPILASFSSPWPLATGSVFDVECRDPKTGDGAFLQVTSNVKGRSLSQLDDSFFVDSLVAPTGRFSFYGQPTDVKVRDSVQRGDNYRTIDLSFSTLSQSTMTEIPRRARVAVTIPDGASQAVLLAASTSAQRYKGKGTDKTLADVAASFRAVPAPTIQLKVRAKERRG